MCKAPTADASAVSSAENVISALTDMANSRDHGGGDEKQPSDELVDLRQMELEFSYSRRDRQLSL